MVFGTWDEGSKTRNQVKEGVRDTVWKKAFFRVI